MSKPLLQMTVAELLHSAKVKAGEWYAPKPSSRQAALKTQVLLEVQRAAALHEERITSLESQVGAMEGVVAAARDIAGTIGVEPGQYGEQVMRDWEVLDHALAQLDLAQAAGAKEGT